MAYKHRIVEGIAQLVEEFGGKGSNPMTKALWYGIKHEIPSLLESLDEDDEAVAYIEDKVREALGVKPRSKPAVVAGEVATEVKPIPVEIKEKGVSYLGEETPRRIKKKRKRKGGD